MSKRKAKTKKKPSAATRPSTPGFPSWLDRPDHSTTADDLLKKIFAALAVVVLVLTLAMAFNSGINADDEYQHDYSEKLVNYYLTLGADTAALYIPKGNMHYYGGVFDLLSGLTNRAMGLTWEDAGYHHVRHFYNAIFGFLAMLFASLLAGRLAGWRAAILTLIFLFLSPRFLGHSLMNPKDIPFAAGYIIAIYYMVVFFENMERPRWQAALGVVLGIGLAIGTRAGGMLLIAYLGMYAALDFWVRNGIGAVFSDGKKVWRYAGWTLGIAIAGYLLAVLFWPWALQAPLSRPFEALGEFSKLGVKIRVLFKGENVMSDQTGWDYVPQWIFRTVPLFALAGFVGAVFMARRLFKQYAVLPVFMLFFAAIFPVVYVIYKESILHDGWRHLLFIYAPLVILSVLWWMQVEQLLVNNKTGRYALYAVVALMAAEPALFIARNTAYPYVYFNPLSGGISGAFGRFETDYWGLSMKQAVQKMEDAGILRPDMTDTLDVASSYSYLLQVYTKKRYQGKVRASYQRFSNRYESEWDYGIFPSRYIKGAHLRAGTWPNSRTVITVDANGVPLTAVEKGGGAVFEGERFFKQQNWDAAAEAFERETREHPDNELAWMKLSMAWLNAGKFAEARHAADQMLRVAPANTSGLLYRGMAALNLGDLNAAENDFYQCVKIESDFATAWYYLAIIKQRRNDLQGALQDLQKCIEASPQFRPAYELAASIYDQLGNAEQARRFRQAIGQ
ncbi:MAG: hypothetical protein KatS3mg029_0195 [Saprospiraceae bacterium]|nr:MAG: hypothetical protein KatS3mg029_0195 [Saprospiraceae bacterium]